MDIETTEEKIKKVDAKISTLQKKKKEVLRNISTEQRKQRTRRLIQAGAIVESVMNRPLEEADLPKLLNRPLEEADLPKLQSFLWRQERNGRYFSKAMDKDGGTEK